MKKTILIALSVVAVAAAVALVVTKLTVGRKRYIVEEWGFI